MTARQPSRVLIVGLNYAPEHAGNAPYTAGFAEYLAVSGRDVTVITAVPHYPAWHVAPEYARRLSLSETRNGVRVIRRAIYVPRRQSAVQRGLYEASFLLSAFPVRRVARPDAIVGIIPGLAGGVLARLFAARLRAPYGLVMQELVGLAAAQSGIAGGSRVAEAARAIERWATARARGVAFVSNSFRPYLAGLGLDPTRLVHLPNWTHIAPPTADRRITRGRLGWDDGCHVVIHAGNMGLKQDLRQVLRVASVAAARGLPIRFVLLGEGSQRAILESEARGMANVSFVDPVPDRDFSDVLAAADILLVTERPTVQDMSLPSKLTSYAIAGRPIVAAVADGGATAHEIERTGMGLLAPAGDTDALLATLQRVVGDEALAGRLVSAANLQATTSYARVHAEEGIERFLGLICLRKPGEASSEHAGPW